MKKKPKIKQLLKSDALVIVHLDYAITWVLLPEGIQINIRSSLLRAWVNDNAMFYKSLIEKKNNKEIIVHLRDKHFECCRSTSSNICEQRLKQKSFASLT